MSVIAQERFQALIPPEVLRSRDFNLRLFEVEILENGETINKVSVNDLKELTFEVTNADLVDLGEYPLGANLTVQYRAITQSDNQGTWESITKTIQFTPLKPYLNNVNMGAIEVTQTRKENTIELKIEDIHLGEGAKECAYEWVMSNYDYAGTYTNIETDANLFTTTKKSQHTWNLISDSYFYVRLVNDADVVSDWYEIHDVSDSNQIFAEKITLETPVGAQAKAEAARDEAKVYADTPNRISVPEPSNVTLSPIT